VSTNCQDCTVTSKRQGKASKEGRNDDDDDDDDDDKYGGGGLCLGEQ
jgi:hypothetical protein